MNNSPQAEHVANKARNSLSNYCIHECHAYCCQKGTLVMTPAQKELLITKDVGEALSTTQDGKFALNMSVVACPKLGSDFSCTVYSEKNRPATCHKFPVFITEKTFHFSERCPAVREGKLYFFEKEFFNIGLQKE